MRIESPMKKRVGILLVACLAIGLLLAGCSGNGSAGSESGSAQQAVSSESAAPDVGDSAASASDNSEGVGADSSASVDGSAASDDSSANASDSSASAASSPKEKADDGLIDVYNFDTGTNEHARWALAYLYGAKEWEDAAVEGDLASIWAYNDALEKVDSPWFEDELALWQRYIGAEEVKASTSVGYAIDGQVIYAYFDDAKVGRWMSGVFDENGKVVFLRGCYEDSSYNCAFKDDVLISHTGGSSGTHTFKPKFIGEWDEDERLAEQEELLNAAYSSFALLKIDDMENVGEVPYDFRYGE